jgi:BetI-type transcriptional repressor, C-terminal
VVVCRPASNRKQGLTPRKPRIDLSPRRSRSSVTGSRTRGTAFHFGREDSTRTANVIVPHEQGVCRWADGLSYFVTFVFLCSRLVCTGRDKPSLTTNGRHVNARPSLEQKDAKETKENWFGKPLAVRNSGGRWYVALPPTESCQHYKFEATRYRLLESPEIYVVLMELYVRSLRDPALARVVAPRERLWSNHAIGILERGVRVGAFRPDLDLAEAASMIMVQI